MKIFAHGCAPMGQRMFERLRHVIRVYMVQSFHAKRGKSQFIPRANVVKIRGLKLPKGSPESNQDQQYVRVQHRNWHTIAARFIQQIRGHLFFLNAILFKSVVIMASSVGTWLLRP
jgi:hypothetical protein